MHDQPNYSVPSSRQSYLMIATLIGSLLGWIGYFVINLVNIWFEKTIVGKVDEGFYSEMEQLIIVLGMCLIGLVVDMIVTRKIIHYIQHHAIDQVKLKIVLFIINILCIITFFIVHTFNVSNETMLFTIIVILFYSFFCSLAGLSIGKN